MSAPSRDCVAPGVRTPAPSVMWKVDLHNHTNLSFDGAMDPRRFMQAVTEAKIDVVAVTDHGTRLGGLAVRELDPPFQVIVGSEIMTSEGELIGLFLDNLDRDLKKGADPVDTAKAIHDAGGLTYLPHPFLPHVLSRMKAHVLPRLLPHLDIVEGLNSRGSHASYDREAVSWARANGKVVGAGSDAHIPSAVGNGYTLVEPFQGPDDFLEKLRAGTRVCRAREHTYLGVWRVGVGVLFGYRRVRRMKAVVDSGAPLRAVWDPRHAPEPQG